jgi:hypothetical protein
MSHARRITSDTSGPAVSRFERQRPPRANRANRIRDHALATASTRFGEHLTKAFEFRVSTYKRAEPVGHGRAEH